MKMPPKKREKEVDGQKGPRMDQIQADHELFLQAFESKDFLLPFFSFFIYFLTSKLLNIGTRNNSIAADHLFFNIYHKCYKRSYITLFAANVPSAETRVVTLCIPSFAAICGHLSFLLMFNV